jgi:hypothetical protein
MGNPQVNIRVDDTTGRWFVDSLPMILVPQHFFLNNHYAVEAVLGPEKLASPTFSKIRFGSASISQERT